MLWAGALETVFDDFQREFSASKIQLMMNHRSAPHLVELQKQMYKSLQEEHVDTKTSGKWETDDGEVKLFVTDNETLESELIAADIYSKIANGLRPNDICILCKQTPQVYTQKVIAKLKECGIKARVETDYQDLIKEPIIVLFINFLRLAIVRRSPNEWEIVNESLLSIYGISDIDMPDEYDKKQEALIIKLNECREKMETIDSEEDLGSLIRNMILFWGLSEIKNAYPAYSQGGYFDIVINMFVKLLWQEYDEASSDWENALNDFLGLNSIPIMTIHKSKGLEYEAVYFIGLEDGAFWNFKNQSMEDRCAFFVALSRAKQTISFTYCNIRESLRYPRQAHKEINEFFQLLTTSGLAEVIRN